MDLGSDQHPDPFRDAIQDAGVPGRPGRLVRGDRHPGVRLPPPGPDPDRRRAGPPGPPRAQRADPRRTRGRQGPLGSPRSTPAGCAAPRLIETARGVGRRLALHRPRRALVRACRRDRPGQVRGTAPRPAPLRHGLVRPAASAKDTGPGRRCGEAAPLFARHPRARDASSVPRPALERPRFPDLAETGSLTGPHPRWEAAGQRRPCDEDFPLDIRDVLAAKAGTATAPTAGEPAPRAVVRPSARGPRP